MRYLTAMYGFRLNPQHDKMTFNFERCFKVGNDPALNELFDSDRIVSLKKLGPFEAINDYIVFPLDYVISGKVKRLIFETATFMHPFGILRVIGNEHDCFLFHVVSDHCYTVYVAEGEYSQSAQLLSMLIDGDLQDDIDELQEIGLFK